MMEDHGLSCVDLVDGGWQRTASTTCAGHERARRKRGWIVLKSPLSVSTLAVRYSVSQNATRQQADAIRNPMSCVAEPNGGLSFERLSGEELNHRNGWNAAEIVPYSCHRRRCIRNRRLHFADSVTYGTSPDMCTRRAVFFTQAIRACHRVLEEQAAKSAARRHFTKL